MRVGEGSSEKKEVEKMIKILKKTSKNRSRKRDGKSFKKSSKNDAKTMKKPSKNRSEKRTDFYGVRPGTAGTGPDLPERAWVQ